ncbi:hypothetical protein BKA70DRAFT_1140796 [Coprinopsis sp. MPI-PUGE-AT-0042]|nr:hypothetical protein BKA70DRAFT_1140796 [Coprinopsis sp. MPI-PUGE-AT-0042]
MPLFVPVLRSAMLFMNIYDSYKTLKPPPPSSRDPTRPSVRAMTQRKRDLKGCLAVWIVFCCFTLYERLVESFISLFIPFYDEFKSMAILFLILTRSRGAEPIFLHVLRPLIHPYDASIDGTLDVLRMTGDFIFALGAFPIQQAIKFLRSRFEFLASYLPGDDFDNTCEPSEVEAKAGRPTASRQSTGATVRGSRKPASRRPSDDFIPDDFLQSPPTTGLALSNGTPYSPPNQIWRPPPSAYEGEYAGEGTPQPSNGIIDLAHDEHASEDWRKYPDFPSAYPATPPQATTNLPPSFGAAATNLFSEPEGAMARQDFHRSLKPTRQPQNPGYATNLSDQNPPSGIPQSYGFEGSMSDTAVDSDEYTDEDEIMTDDDGDMSYDEEDSFDKTLQTPFNRRVLLSSPQAPPLSAFPSQSTAVDSVDTVTSLQTRTASGSSASGQSISSPPLSSSSKDVEMEVDSPAVQNTTNEGKPKLRQRSGTVTRDRPPVPRRRMVRAASPAKKRKVARPPLGPGGSNASANSPTGPGDGEESGQAPLDAGTEASSPDVYVPNDQKQIQPEPKRPRVAASGTPASSRKGAISTTSSTVRGTTKARGARGASPPLAAGGSVLRGARASSAVKTIRGTQLPGTVGTTRGLSGRASSTRGQSGKLGTGGTGSRAGVVAPGLARKASSAQSEAGPSTNTEQRSKSKSSQDQISVSNSLENGNQTLDVTSNDGDNAPSNSGQ